MESKTFYDVVLSDIDVFDKIIYDLQRMSNEAPNARIRTVADTAIANIRLSQEICKALKDADNKSK